MDYIKGNFKKYIFRSDKGYVVGLFKVRDTSLISYKNKTITFTGYFSNLNESDLYIFNGKLTNHERYGVQFTTSSYETILPEEKDNIIEFLSSNLFKGISQKKASDVVEALGTNCLNLILENKEVLNNVPKITIKQKDIIYNSLTKYQDSYNTIVELTKLGFSSKDALVINSHYKSKTLNIIKENPYLIIDDLKEITFKKIDKLRNNFDILDDNINRVKAGIKYVFNEINYSFGSTYLEKLEIFVYTKKVLNIYDESLIEEALNELLKCKDIVVFNDRYYLKEMYIAEKYISDRLYKLSAQNNKIKVTLEDIKKQEKLFNIVFNPNQVQAIEQSMKHNFLVITGGPGTGKTTIIKAICTLYQDLYGIDNKELVKTLALLAPTGRASKRISEQTNLPSSTIHRFLKWDKESNTFDINEDNKSDVKFVIIDESSMIDTYLLYNLLLGLKDNTKIIMIGDSNQLPSVGPGQVLKDIIDSKVINCISLSKLYRQKENSNINLLAYNINSNEIDYSIFNKNDDLLFIEANSLNLKEKMKEYILEYKDLDFNKFQVLAPIYKGENGIDNLNYFIQDLINYKESNKILHDGIIFKENDKVLHLVNNIDENIFNGDIGRVVRINNKLKEVYIDFDDNIVRFTTSDLSNLKLGYTISIHKAQGSEFDFVIIPLLNEYSNMLYKKLIYTGVTRAKKKLILIGELSALERSIKTNREDTRKTSLKDFLISCIETK